MGAVMAGGSIGSLFFIPLLTFITLNYSWQLAWIIMGLFGLIVVVPLFIIVLKNDPSELKNNSSEILETLEVEIAGHYYYQNGIIEASSATRRVDEFRFIWELFSSV